MTDKEKIRAEIERLKKCSESAKMEWIHTGYDQNAFAEDCRIASFNKLLFFIDSMQEKPASIWHDGCENPKSETNVLMIRKDEEDSNYPPIAGCFHGTNFRLDGKNWGYYNGFCYNEIEPPVKWAYIDDILNLSNVVRIGKDWKESVSEDLGEYINKLSKQFPEVSFAKLSRIAVRVAKWQKEKMMAKAINTEASLTMSVPSICISLPLGVNVGDKVKVIVIKED